MRPYILACAVVSLASCTDDSAGTQAASDSAPNSTGSLTLPTSGGDPSFDLGSLDLGTPDCGLNNGELGLSYIWIANSTQGTVSKIDLMNAANSGEYGGTRRVG